MSSPPRGSRTPRSSVPATPTRRSARNTPTRGSQASTNGTGTPRQNGARQNESQTPPRSTPRSGNANSPRTPSRRILPSDDGTPMRWGANRPAVGEEVSTSSDLPIVSTSPVRGVQLSSPPLGNVHIIYVTKYVFTELFYK